MTIKSSILSGSVLIFACACAPAAPPAAPQATAHEDLGGGDRDARPRALITSPLQDATNLGADLRITAVVSCRKGGACATDPEGTQKLVARKIKLLDARGRSIAVAPQAAAKPAVDARKEHSEPVPVNQYDVTFVPVRPLDADAAYTVELTSDGEAVVGFAGAPLAEESAAAAATSARPTRHAGKIATSSDPMPTRVEMSADPKKAVRSVRVAFTEPVSLATLAQGGLTITDENGQTIEACAWSALQSACATEKSADVSNLVDFVFLGDVSPKALETATLSVATTVSGEGESVAEAAASRGLDARSGVARDRVELSLKDGVWETCSAAGDVRCMRNLKPR